MTISNWDTAIPQAFDAFTDQTFSKQVEDVLVFGSEFALGGAGAAKGLGSLDRLQSPVYFKDLSLSTFNSTVGFDKLGVRNPIKGRPKPLIGSNGQRIPFGFANEADFLEFSRVLRAGLPEGVEPVFKGSAVTGVKAVTSKGIKAGTPFDVGRKSDFDIGLISEDLTTRTALIDGVRIKTQPTRIGPIGIGSDAALNLELNDLLIRLEGLSNRKVEFNLFDTPKGGFKGETIVVPWGN